MKKTVLIAVAMFSTFMFANAQYRPDKMDVTTEVYYSPGGATDGAFELPTYGMNVRLFLSEKWAVKLNLGVATSTDTDFTYYTDANNAEQSRRERTGMFNMVVMPGVEYHFTRFERVSPYIGAGIGVEFGSQKNRTDNTENSDYTLSTRPTFGMSAMLTSGVDVYICKGLYAGAEIGVAYAYSNTGKGKNVTATGNTITENKGTVVNRSGSFGFYAIPSLRIGWVF